MSTRAPQLGIRRRPHLRTIALAIVSVALLSGCYRVNVKVAVEEDGSGTAEAVLAIDPDAMGGLMGSMGDMFEDLEEDGDSGSFDDEFSRDVLCADSFEESFGVAPSGVEVEEYDEDGFCGQRRTISFAAGDDVSAALNVLMAESDGDAGDGSFTIQRSGDGWRFDATDLGSSAGLGETDDTEFVSPEMMEMLMGDAEFTIEVQLPGRPVDHNATSVDGNTFKWEIDLMGQSEPLFAITEPGSPDSESSLTWLWILLGLVALGALAFFIIKKRGSGDGPATPPGPPAPATVPTSPPTPASTWAPTPTPPPPPGATPPAPPAESTPPLPTPPTAPPATAPPATAPPAAPPSAAPPAPPMPPTTPGPAPAPPSPAPSPSPAPAPPSPGPQVPPPGEAPTR